MKVLTGHTDRISSVAISSNDKYIVSGSDDKSVRVWELENGQVFKELFGHSDCVSSVAISTDNNYIVSGSYDCSVLVWERESG